MLAGAADGEGDRGEVKKERGRVRAGVGVMKAHSGAAWPARTEQRRRAADGTSTRRLCSEAGRPLYIRDSVDSDEQRDV